MKLNSVIQETLREIQNCELTDIREIRSDHLLQLRSAVDKIINKIFNDNKNKPHSHITVQTKPKKKLQATTTNNNTNNSTNNSQNNIVLHGFQPFSDNNQNVLEIKVREFMKTELNLEIKNIKATPLGDQKLRNSSVLIKLASVKDRQSIFKHCKNLRKELGVFITEDLSKSDRIKRKQQLGDLIEAKKQGKRAYFRGSTLIIKENTEGHFVRFSPKVAEKLDRVCTTFIENLGKSTLKSTESYKQILKFPSLRNNNSKAIIQASANTFPTPKEVKKDEIKVGRVTNYKSK